MTCIITALYILSTIRVIASWAEFRAAFVFGISSRERYNLMYSFMLWEIMDAAASALSLIIADCTIVRIFAATLPGFPLLMISL